MFVDLFKSIVASAREEGFAGSPAATGGVVIFALLFLAAIIAVKLYLVQWLWNTVLVSVISVARPLPSLMYTLGLLILVGLIHPSYVTSEIRSAQK